MTTRVVNIRSLPPNLADWPANHVYIGRAMLGHRGNYVLRGSIWQNHLKVGEDGTRDEVIARYEQRVKQQPRLLDRLPELKDKTLVCWCWPERCHGDVLARMADEQDDNR